MTDLTEAERTARLEQAHAAIARGLFESYAEWVTGGRLRRPTFNFDLAADYAMDALGDQAAEILADGTLLRSLTTQDGVVSLELEPATDILKLFVASMRGVLDGYGAENYVETEMTAPSVSMDVRHGPDPMDSYTVTVQRRTGTTPHQFRVQAEERAEKAEAALERAELDAEQQERNYRVLMNERTSYREAWKYEQKRRAKAEAAVGRLRAFADDVDTTEWRAPGPEVAGRIRAAISAGDCTCVGTTGICGTCSRKEGDL
ncbi:hypothetical protein [Streptomyces gardneri]|uniref:hypothetical protein n=1 Tax=Streptomyces gardneri TaxID=66892 RepID=UPI0036C5F007